MEAAGGQQTPSVEEGRPEDEPPTTARTHLPFLQTLAFSTAPTTCRISLSALIDIFSLSHCATRAFATAHWYSHSCTSVVFAARSSFVTVRCS